MSAGRLAATLPARLAGHRLDGALAEIFPGYSRSRMQRWIREGRVHVDGRAAGRGIRVAGGEQVEVEMEGLAAAGEEWRADPARVPCVHEDPDLIVVDKPVGLVVHPGAGNRERTLANGLLHRYPELARVPRAGLVHRLDKDTSGLLVVARTLRAHHHLVSQIRQRAMLREYDAIVRGRMPAGSGRIDAPIARHRTHRTRMAVDERGRPATTHYRVCARYPGFTHLRLRLSTGRTHQIRVHLAHAGHPVAGDPVYGGHRAGTPAPPPVQRALRELRGQALHASRLALAHPLDQRWCEWRSAPPEELRALLTVLGNDRDAAR